MKRKSNNNKNNRDKVNNVEHGYLKLLRDVAAFEKRVYNLVEEGFSLSDATHLAEGEMFSRLMGEADMDKVTVDSVRVLANGLGRVGR